MVTRERVARGDGRRRWPVRLVPALLVVGMVLGGAPASASGGDDGTPVEMSLTVVYQNLRPGVNGTRFPGGALTISTPPTCWWQEWDTGLLAQHGIAPDDPDRMKKYFEARRHSFHVVPQAVYEYPGTEYVAAHDSPEYTWYELGSAEGVNCFDEGFTSSATLGPPGAYPGSGRIPRRYAAFLAAPPPPVVDVPDVVERVWEQVTAVIEAPQMGRNPEIADADGATLVNLPTWFWVRNPQAALAGDGRIRLRVSIPGTPVWARLEATTESVRLTSPVGGVDCPLDAALTTWAADVPASSGCTLAFSRARTGGWPVGARTVWEGEWVGGDQDGPASGTLETVATSATTEVPVLESQALVTGVE